MIGIAIFCWCIAAALTVQTSRRFLGKCWRWCREHYRIIWLLLYTAYFVWCVWYEHKTGRAGIELFVLLFAPAILYLIETKEDS